MTIKQSLKSFIHQLYLVLNIIFLGTRLDWTPCVNIGVRATGSLDEERRVKDIKLLGFDIVSDPVYQKWISLNINGLFTKEEAKLLITPAEDEDIYRAVFIRKNTFKIRKNTFKTVQIEYEDTKDNLEFLFGIIID